MSDETAIGGPDVRFAPTLWTMVLEAKDGSRDAQDRLITAYWKPVYFYVRRRGHDIETAKDLTQSFFATSLEKDFLQAVSRDKGRFRSFVLAALGHFLSNEYDRARAKKRGGDFNFVEAETELVAADTSPDKAFQRQWALEVLARAMDRLRSEVSPSELGLLSGTAPPGMTPTDRKNRTHRLRLRLRQYLHEEILPSVATESEIETEMRELFSALG